MFPLNKELATQLREMGTMYAFLNGDNRFRSRAYERASRLVEDLEEGIRNYTEEELEGIKGIGHGIATKIEEYIETGRIKKHEELKNKVPYALIHLVNLKGFGPKTLKTIHEELGVNTRAELEDALSDGRIEKLKGFGKKRVQNMLDGLEIYKHVEDRIPLWEALAYSDRLLDQLKSLKKIDKLEVAGSIRRKKETIGDIDILASCKEKDRESVIEQFVSIPGVKGVLAKGATKASIVLDDEERQADLRLVDPDQWGAALVYFTGSKQHNVHIRTIARDNGYKLSEYGLFERSSDKRVAGKSEEEIYSALGMQWMPPEMRTDTGEVELALNQEIPELVESGDIRGDLQMHSDWSDGMHKIEEIAEYVRDHFDYDYIAITDHSKAVRVAGGMDESEFLEQIREIAKVNENLGEDFIKSGIEVDINTDGSLDMSEKVLEKLDWVVASIHTQLERDNTDRLIKACENPFVHVIGHPTGRMIGSRKPYPVDMEKVIQAAKKTGTALEINAQPERMDLNDRLARMAREAGVKLVISTDSHSNSNFAYMKLGVAIARRAWCRKEDILNTTSWDHILAYFKDNGKKI